MCWGVKQCAYSSRWLDLSPSGRLALLGAGERSGQWRRKGGRDYSEISRTKSATSDKD